MLDNFVEAVAALAVLLFKIVIAVWIAIGLYIAFDSAKTNSITRE